jgi:RNA polymerase sigma-70 factor, ECF subfamily
MTAAVLPIPFGPLQPAARTKDGQKLASAARVEPARPVAPETTDEDLFASARKGDSSALEKLIKRHEASLFGLLSRLTNNDSHRAEDIFQETFLNAMRRAETFNKAMRFKPWITAIAVNLVRDDARRRKTRGEVALDGSTGDDEKPVFDPATSAEGPGHSAERRDDERLIREGLKRLTEVEREVVLLHFYNAMTLQEASEVLEIPLGTVKSRLHAALTRLSEILKRFKPEQP